METSEPDQPEAAELEKPEGGVEERELTMALVMGQAANLHSLCRDLEENKRLMEDEEQKEFLRKSTNDLMESVLNALAMGVQMETLWEYLKRLDNVKIIDWKKELIFGMAPSIRLVELQAEVVELNDALIGRIQSLMQEGDGTGSA